MTSNRPFRWLLAIFGGIFVGASVFLGAVATNLLTDDMEQVLAPEGGELILRGRNTTADSRKQRIWDRRSVASLRLPA